MSLPAKLLAALLALAAAFAAGWVRCDKAHAVAAAKQALADSEANREAERLAGRNMTRISDALTKDRLATAGRAAQLERRLRDIAESSPAPAPNCPSRNDDARPAAAVLSDDTRGDLVALAQEADATADRLRACQAAAVIGEGGR